VHNVIAIRDVPKETRLNDAPTEASENSPPATKSERPFVRRDEDLRVAVGERDTGNVIAAPSSRVEIGRAALRRSSWLRIAVLSAIVTVGVALYAGRLRSHDAETSNQQRGSFDLSPVVPYQIASIPSKAAERTTVVCASGAEIIVGMRAPNELCRMNVAGAFVDPPVAIEGEPSIVVRGGPGLMIGTRAPGRVFEADLKLTRALSGQPFPGEFRKTDLEPVSIAADESTAWALTRSESGSLLFERDLANDSQWSVPKWLGSVEVELSRWRLARAGNTLVGLQLERSDVNVFRLFGWDLWPHRWSVENYPPIRCTPSMCEGIVPGTLLSISCDDELVEVSASGPGRTSAKVRAQLPRRVPTNYYEYVMARDSSHVVVGITKYGGSTSVPESCEVLRVDPIDWHVERVLVGAVAIRSVAALDGAVFVVVRDASLGQRLVCFVKRDG